MADNLTISQGTGTTIATDEVGSAHYQRVKPVWGADGTATDISTSSGGPLPVQLRDNDGTDVAMSSKLGSLTETAPASDTASSGLNGRLQRIAQRLTSLIALVPAALGQTTKAASLAVTVASDDDLQTKIGGVTETAPATDTASSGLNGRLQRIAQRLTSLIALVPAALTVSGNFKVSVEEDTTSNKSVNVAQINGVAPLMGAGNTGTGSHRVTVATDQAAIATWGNGATGAAVPSGAQYEGLNPITSLPSAATAGNLVGATSDKFGRQVILPVTIRDLVGRQTTTISASTTETTIVTAAADVFNDLVMLIISNTSASTNTRIDFRDTTGGTVLFSIQSNGGQPPVGFVLPVPIPQSGVNTNWTAQCATSTTDIRVLAVFAKNK